MDGVFPRAYCDFVKSELRKEQEMDSGCGDVEKSFNGSGSPNERGLDQENFRRGFRESGEKERSGALQAMRFVESGARRGDRVAIWPAYRRILHNPFGK